MVTLPDNLKTLSVGDVVRIYIKWNDVKYFDDDAKVTSYDSSEGIATVEFVDRKNPDGSKMTGQFGLWAIARIEKEAEDSPTDPRDKEMLKMLERIGELVTENTKLKKRLYDIHVIVSSFGG